MYALVTSEVAYSVKNLESNVAIFRDLIKEVVRCCVFIQSLRNDIKRLMELVYERVNMRVRDRLYIGFCGKKTTRED